jgi:hypothetical protein
VRSTSSRTGFEAGSCHHGLGPATSAQTIGTLGLLQARIYGEQVLAFVPSKKRASFAIFISGGVGKGDGAGWQPSSSVEE